MKIKERGKNALPPQMKSYEALALLEIPHLPGFFTEVFLSDSDSSSGSSAAREFKGHLRQLLARRHFLAAKGKGKRQKAKAFFKSRSSHLI